MKTQSFFLTIDQQTVKVDPKNYFKSDLGHEGSLLRAALSHDLKLDHRCGGAGRCTTCHVYVLKGEEALSKIQIKEENQLKQVYGRQKNSRLACQCFIETQKEIILERP
ncbi:MAG: 2Fe-2S iron-sulfur cluster binding domain-containing protein [Deltaproteobacteria bacterium]|nr:2Fe-2S iron-sulfur cluster binding domain-containing protein [Deltaproteobacteria bacterium]